MALTLEGFSDKEIAARLSIAPSTIKSYWIRIRQKTRSFTRMQAVACMDRDSKSGSSRTQDAWLDRFWSHTGFSVIVCGPDSHVVEARLGATQLSNDLRGRRLTDLMSSAEGWDEAVFRVRMNRSAQALSCELNYRGEKFNLRGEVMPVDGSSPDQLLYVIDQVVQLPNASVSYAG